MKISRCILTASLALSGLAAAAGEKPLWELGLGVGVVSFPDYRGSDHQRTWLLPVPYVIYRGEFLRADREGVRGRFFDSDRIELNLSLSASVPVDSDGSTAREGMDDLEPTVEIGPTLDLTLWRSADRDRTLDLRLPLRWAVTVSGSPRDVGIVFSPRLNLDLRNPFGHAGWNFGLQAGPIFTDRRNNAFYYDVASADATPTRPAYASRGGYGGSQFVAALSKRFDTYWVGGFARYDALDGAVFDDSPLVRSRSAWAVGIGIAWMLGESSRRVSNDD